MLTPDWLDVMGSVSGSTGPLAPPPSQRSVVGREVCGPGPGEGLITFHPLNHTISPLITTNHPLIFYNNASFTR